MAKSCVPRSGLRRLLLFAAGCMSGAVLLHAFWYFDSQCTLEADESVTCASAALTIWVNGLLTSTQATLPPPRLAAAALQPSGRKEHLLTIFTAPLPYTRSPADPQRLALQSWLTLTPAPSVVLFGNHPSFFAVALEHPGAVTVAADVDCNFRGVPLLHSMLAAVEGVSTDFAMLVPADTLLFDPLYQAVQQAHLNLKQFLLVGARWKAESFPFELLTEGDGARQWKSVSGVARDEAVLHAVRSKADLDPSKVDVLLWNQPSEPLLKQPVPPFAYGRGSSDTWLTRSAIAEGLRTVVDCTELLGGVVVGGQLESSDLLSPETAEVSLLSRLPRWNIPQVEEWEVAANHQLALRASGDWGSAGGGSVVHAPARLGACPGSEGEEVLQLCFIKRLHEPPCTCSYFACASLAEGEAGARGQASLPCNSSSAASPLPPGAISIASNRSRTLEDLLPLVADMDKNVIVIAATNHYISMLMSFVCRLQALQVGSLLVAAMDEEAYDFAFLQGLPVYLEALSDEAGVLQTPAENCTYTSQCFKRASKGKSQAVLHILQRGYNVLFSDVDIVWFRNPLRDLMSFGPGILPMQSDVWRRNGSANAQLNSGFYYARAEPSVLRAFEAIFAAEQQGKGGSQQVYFNRVLCGTKLGGAKVGSHQCEWQHELVVQLLDRDQYPNGQYGDFWAGKNVAAACQRTGCFVLHNNWISGRDLKISRFKDKGLWFYDEDRRLCKPGRLR